MAGEEMYIGDGIYAEFTGHHIKLITERPIPISPGLATMYLGATELSVLIHFARKVKLIEE